MTNATAILNSVTFPSAWKFVPIGKGGKAPIGTGWQTKPFGFESVPNIGDRYQGKDVGAVGVMCGNLSGGVLMVDCDGATAKDLLKDWALGEVPKTWCVTSGRPGRGQLVFQVPDEFRQVIETRKYKTEDGEMLELRWDGCQSLVYGAHPSGSQYQWLNTDCEIAIAPSWLIEKMLKDTPTPSTNGNDKRHKPNWRDFDRNFRMPSDAVIPLEICLSRGDRDLIERGEGSGSRNDAGFRLAVNLLATAQYLEGIGQRFEGIPEQLFDRFCHACPSGDGWRDREWDQIWKSAEKRGGGTSLTPEAIEGCVKGWVWKNQNPTQNSSSNTGVDATHRATHAQTPLTVSLSDVGVLSVATQREKNDFAQLQEMQSTVFDPALMLPTTLAKDMIRDANLLAIDPVAIWVYLLPAISSMMGQITIDFSGWKVPNIVWSLIAQKSGRGKTRAMSLVNAPLWELEAQAEETFQAAMKQYKSDLKSSAKNGDEEPTKPIREKFLFNIATPQAVVKRLGEQKRGVVWSRDEFKGLVKSLDQFSGEGEGLEILLETWDGKCAQVDRVDTENSFFVPESRLSLGGGTQPKVLKKMLDPEDPQGFMARMLIATAQDIEYKRVKGSTVLGDKLGALYSWVDSNDWSGLAPTEECDDLFTTIAEYYNNAPSPNDAIDNWQKKAAGQCIRVAGVLHVLECYYDNNKKQGLITRDTLMRAYYYVSLCHRWLYVIQGCMAESSAVSNLLQKILDKTKALGGSATLPDLYRNINPLRKLAKDEGQTISEVTLSLCHELESMGKGVVKTDDKGKQSFEILPTLNTRKTETLTQPAIEPCVDTNTYQHTATHQHTAEDSPQKEESTPPIEEIKVGDEVTILDIKSPYKGRVGEAKELTTTSTGETLYRVVRDYEGTPELNFDATFPHRSIRVRPKSNYTWEPA